MNIIHIGIEKTGTTQLQKFFLDNKSVLRESFSIDFRCSKTGGHSSDIINSVSDIVFQDLPKEEFKNQLEWTQKNQLVSSEHFSSRLINESEILRLKNFLDFKGLCTVVSYIKPQEELLVGMYAEALKAGRAIGDLPSFDKILTNKYYGLSYFDFMKMLAPWKNVFTDMADFKVLPYRRDSLVERDISRDFSEKILKDYGDTSKLKLPRGDSNKTFSPEVLLTLRRFESKFPQLPKYKLHNYLLEFDIFGKGTFLNLEELESFRRLFEGSNSELADCYNMDQLFCDVKNVRSISRDYVMDDANFDSLVKKVSSKIEKDENNH